jgi:predicted SprT family Zn-dependent metalloprotease
MQMDFLAKLWERVLAPSSMVPLHPPPAAAPIPATSDSAEELLARARQLLRGIGCGALAERLTVRWNPRMRSTAGTANWSRCLINLNPQLRQFGAAEVDGTLRHELAHLVAQFRAGRRRIPPHGREWQRACADLGIKGEKRCHELPLQRRELARKYRYQCPACGLEVGRVRAMRRRTACLACCRMHARGRYDDRFRFVRVG